MPKGASKDALKRAAATLGSEGGKATYNAGKGIFSPAFKKKRKKAGKKRK